ncbi:MAG: Asp-tRNA(Asn)/Glu-tRNA(Gln) amidotransferase subunit GatC [Candidatus Zambryskibacteria bacterium]|nr:Asp-tRNA(Asn)/Glu-tRNA(Gln) amidotransferase subunit GatC [Candidatus Zambryskibacteria bacterium]
MNKEEVLKLAKLARIDVSDEEAENLAKELGSILNYVSEIKSVDVSEGSTGFTLKNVFRSDSESHPSGQFTDAILAQAPSREGDYIKVKKIL